MKDTIFGVPRNEIADELIALGLNPDISTIRGIGVDGYDGLKSDDIEAEQLSKIKWHKVKDWSDYVLFHEKTVSDDIDFRTGNHITVIDLYYTVNNLPMTGNGDILVTENIKELTLDEYINRYIQYKYTNNPYIELRNIKQI